MEKRNNGGEEVIINDCKNLGEHAGFYKDEKPELHFECNETDYRTEGHKCLFPRYITNPKCCAGYTSGGEKKVEITKKKLIEYYMEGFESLIESVQKIKPDILKEI